MYTGFLNSGFALALQRYRSMLVKRLKPIPVEAVVRGYLAGSGWKEYQDNGEVCGVKLPAGLKNASKLPEPIFTPATKAEKPAKKGGKKKAEAKKEEAPKAETK